MVKQSKLPYERILIASLQGRCATTGPFGHNAPRSARVAEPRTRDTDVESLLKRDATALKSNNPTAFK